MNNTVTKPLEYAQCSEAIKRRIESVFEWTLEHNPYPQSIEERIKWVHSMDKARRSIEAESVVLARLGRAITELPISFPAGKLITGKSQRRDER